MVDSFLAIGTSAVKGYHLLVAWLVRTFTTETGGKPVEEWMTTLEAHAKAEVLILIELLEHHGTELRQPFSKYLEDGIWELRARGPDGIYRVLYFHWFAHTFGLLHGFTKKTRATPRGELELAKRRRATWLSRPGP